MEPTDAVILGSSVLVAQKILGPTADYVGDGLRHWAEHRVNNVKRIFSNAERRLGDGIETPGAVPPRVLGRILDEGSYSDDALSVEYLGGVLASSRSGQSRDDRGVMMVALIARLSSYQLRTHYVLYSTAHTALVGDTINFGMQTDRRQLAKVFMPYSTYMPAMDFTAGENPGIAVSHAFYGLVKEQLIDDEFGFSDDPAHLAQFGAPHATSGGIVFQVSPLGIELYLWAHGLSDVPVQAFLDVRDRYAALDAAVSILPGSVACSRMAPTSTTAIALNDDAELGAK